MRQLKLGCEEVEEERARVGGDAVVLCLWLNVEPVRLRGDQSMRCAASKPFCFLKFMFTFSGTHKPLIRVHIFGNTQTINSCSRQYLSDL